MDSSSLQPAVPKVRRTTTATLRAACERCRAQKLRCVPSSNTDSGPPCQRCVSANVSELCVFRTRSRTRRTGPYRKFPGSAEGHPWTSHKGKESSTPAFPGMSAFVLPTSSSSSAEVDPDPLGSLSTEHTPRMLSPDDDTAAVGNATDDSTLDFWQHDASDLASFSIDSFLQQQSSLLFGANESSSCEQGDSTMASTKTSCHIDGSAHTDFQDVPLSPSNFSQADSGDDMDMSTEERPGPLIDLTALLAEMSPHEDQLLSLSIEGLDDYPIGDALFFSHRFCAILSDYSHLPSTDSTSRLGTPTMLLALSCFMTLSKIYSQIFGHLQEQLSRLPEAHSAHESRTCEYQNKGAGIHSYRGLQLRQLEPICLCTGWDPTKKAVSMLLSSLGGAEEYLGLPLAIRIMSASGAKAQGKKMSKFRGAGGVKTVLFEEGPMAALTTGHLYKTVGKQAKELRGRIEEVNELLKGMPDIAYVVRTPLDIGKERQE